MFCVCYAVDPHCHPRDIAVTAASILLPNADAASTAAAVAADEGWDPTSELGVGSRRR